MNGTDNAESLNLVYIIGTYPLLTTTFIDREIVALRKQGASVQIVSIRKPSGLLSPEQMNLQQGVIYLLPVSWLSFLRGHLRYALRRTKTYFGTLLYLLTRSHPTFKSRLKTIMHFNEGVYAAHLLNCIPGVVNPFTHIHAHFIDRAATVALVVGRLLQLPFSVTAHANDIYVQPVLLPEKLSGAKFVATCTKYNDSYLAKVENGRFGNKIKCIYHGLDTAKYCRSDSLPELSKNGPTVVLSVGQLKEKKGFPYLLKACRILIDQGFDLKCQIVGEGLLRPVIEEEIRNLSLQEAVTLYGALPQQEVQHMYQLASAFALPALQAVDGDRDGIPNVILEAMAMELPVVSTFHSAIPEVIEDGVNGLLVPPGDSVALAEALAKLISDREYGRQLGQKARETIVEKFNLEQNVKLLVTEFS